MNALKPLLSCLFLIFLPAILFSQSIGFSHQRGFYDAPFSLTISGDAGQQIRYTTNGTAPTINTGTVYSGPISITTTTVLRAIAVSGGSASAVQTQSYIFLNSVIHQPANIAGWPNKPYALGSGTATAIHDYEMDPAIADNPAYSEDLIKGLKEIPTLSIVLDKNSFQTMYDGDIEVLASAEIIYANSPGLNEQFEVGIEAHSHLRLKRSLRLTFDNAPGGAGVISKIFRNAPLNSATATDQFNKAKVVLRAGNNRSWARNWNPDRTAYTRDQWYRDAQIAMTGYGSHGTFVHLYVDGLYWGLYNPSERPDAGFQAKYFGGNFEDWLSFDSDGVRSGDATRFNYLSGTLVNKDMSIAANYNEMQGYLDVENFIDYLILTWFTGMTDWPQNNFQGGNRNVPSPTPNKYFAWDCEWSWDVTNGSNNGAWVHPDFRSNQTTGTSLLAKLWHSLRKNPQFMSLFADRVSKHCFNNGALTDAASVSRWTTLNNFISNAIIAESARWGDALNDGVTRTKNDHWTPEVNRVKTLMQGNVQRFVNALIAEGYFSLLLPPSFSREGGATATPTTLTITNPNAAGSIYYTKTGNDPKNANGSISSDAVKYSGAVSITGDFTVIKARVYDGTNWSSLHEGTYFFPQLKINEFLASNSEGIVDESGVHEDWIEIYNKGTQPVNIGGMYITDLLSNPVLYQIPNTDPAKTTIPPKGYLLLWADNQPTEGVLHVNVKLSASGESIGLAMMIDGTPTYIDQLSFGAQSADVSTGSFPDGSTTVRTFTTPTPGAANLITQISGVYINEVAALNTNGITDEKGEHDPWIEIFNKNASPVNIGGLYITNNLSNQLLFQIPSNSPASTTIPANGYIILWADNQPAQGPLHIGLTLNATGGNIALVSNDGAAPYVIDQLQYGSIAPNTSFGRYPDGSTNLKSFVTPTPAKFNTIPLVTGLYINEYLASNNASNTDEFGEFEDWIEIYNSTSNAIDIGGLFITDNLSNPGKWQIPTNRPDLTVIPAGGFKLLYADEQPSQGALHVNIKLGAGGEDIGLSQLQGGVSSLINGLTFGAQTSDVSEGRVPDGGNTIQAFTKITPGASNVTIANQKPIANAGVDQTITSPASSVKLNGSGTDDGSIKTYTWSQASGPNTAVFSGKTIAAPTVSGLVVGVYVFNLVVTDNLDLASVADQVTVTVKAASTGTPLFRINAGGPAYTSAGIAWQADQYFTGGDVYSSTDPIAGTTNDQLYQTERWGNVSYAIPVPNGKYTLRLHFAEIFWTEAGSRVFSVNIENGQASIPNLDIFSSAGGANTALAIDRAINVTDGVLNFNLVAGIENPKLSGIEILTLGPVPNARPVANAGVDQKVFLPASTSKLIGSGTDDVSIKGYTWSQVSGPNTATFNSKTIADPTVGGLIQGTYVFSLVVTDNLGLPSAADRVIVTVSNPAPVANAGTDQQIIVPVSTTKLNGSGTDNGTIKTYSWTQVSGPNTAVFNSKIIAAPTVSGLVQGAYVFSLIVTDNLDQPSVADRVVVSVVNPRPLANAGADQTITAPVSTVQLNGSGTDNGSIRNYRWRQVSGPNTAVFSNATVPAPTVSGLIPGSYAFSLTVADNLNAASLPDTMTVTVSAATGAMSRTAVGLSADGSVPWEVKVLPNPSTHYFNINVNSSAKDRLWVGAYDGDGKLIEKMERVNNGQQLRMGQNYRPGVYYIKVIQGDKVKVLKVIKQ
ncbi:PKD domain-containing protein [Pollutibacter soli]|uniref:PKD domain-containing protein n=1 Tax=Pollutibacter soli TaxID=3034157 RepID=UPI0030135DC1